jgi:predicted O-methyltransferase YrrM
MLSAVQKYYDGFTVGRLLKSGQAPAYLERAFRYLAGQPVSFSEAEKAAFAAIEERRELMRASAAGAVDIFYSPKPASADNLDRPAPGKVVQFDIAKIATHTSVSPFWGRFLHILASDAGSRRILELGACAGISGCYLSTARSCEAFDTIEASEQLAAIAAANLADVSPVGKVHHALFDDVLDTMLPAMGEARFDLVWIDGHHEKVATWHYFARVKPYLADGALVLFDDISWSYDMRDCWEALSAMPGFSHTFDLKTLKGLGVWSGGEVVPQYRFVARPLGQIHIGDPAGWKDADAG